MTFTESKNLIAEKSCNELKFTKKIISRKIVYKNNLQCTKFYSTMQNSIFTAIYTAVKSVYVDCWSLTGTRGVACNMLA